ncbi:Ninja-family protein AFP2 [Linum perenne]
MGEAEGTVSRTMESLSLEISSYPRDLLTRFGGVHQKKRRLREEGSESDEIELSLGLSLGGRFGVDKTTKLVRSSSISSIPVESSYPLLMRTSSLPAETEEEWRKRKEMQSLRRMEAKRRRSEKQSDLDLDSRRRSSSGVSELTLQGSSNVGESRSTTSNQSMQDQRREAGFCIPVTRIQENPARALPSSAGDKRGKGVGGTSAVEDMPCVFTIGDGPKGRRVEGILYKYAKGEEVRIMCVCHGSFLSPAEFVKHAGGSDVDHPLRHIVVSPSGPSFL